MIMKNRWLEFFTGEGDTLSMARLLSFMAFFPASYVLLKVQTTEALGVFITAFVLNAVGNKFLDVKARANANSTNT